MRGSEERHFREGGRTGRSWRWLATVVAVSVVAVTAAGAAGHRPSGAPPREVRLAPLTIPSGEAHAVLAPSISGFDPGVAGTPRCEIESHHVTFDDVLPGEPAERPGAIAVRVFSDRAWSLRLGAAGPLCATAGAGVLPPSRIAWRTPMSGRYDPLPDGRTSVVARGAATTGAGELVVVDLRLVLENADPLGSYGSQLRFELDY